MSDSQPPPTRVIDYSTIRPPNVFERWCLRRTPKVVTWGIVLVPSVVFSWRIFNPSSYYATWLVIPFWMGIWFGPFALCSMLRDKARVAVLERGYIDASVARHESPILYFAMFLYFVVFVAALTGLPLVLGHLFVRAPFNEIRDAALAANGAPVRVDRSIGPFRITHAEAVTDDARTVVVCYTSEGGFPTNGSGFFWTPDELPGYNRGSDGPLFGGWYWFTTD